MEEEGVGRSYSVFLLILYHYFATFLLPVVFIGVFTAFFNISLGVRSTYMRILLYIFELGAKLGRNFELEEEEVSVCDLNNSSKGEIRHRIIQCNAVNELKKKLKADWGIKDNKGTFLEIMVEDAVNYTAVGMTTIVEDEVSSGFEVAELDSWNLLTRTKSPFLTMNWRLKIFWVVGVLIRYFVLATVRLGIMVVGLGLLGLSSIFISLLPNNSFRKKIREKAALANFRVMAKTISLQPVFYNIEIRDGMEGGVCVANHTSPLDTIVLGTKHSYALTGQRHGGMLGYVESNLSNVIDHVWFERSDKEARNKVSQLLREHAESKDKPPILLFPEGVCVNNTATMQFKKGAFEASRIVYPIAMKYDSRFGDAFWYQDTWYQHIIGVLTSELLLYVSGMGRFFETVHSETKSKRWRKEKIQ